MLIILTCGSFMSGGCIYNLYSRMGVIPMSVFPVCWDDENVKTPWRWCRCIETCRSAYDVENIKIYVVHLMVWITNRVVYVRSDNEFEI